jgi:hypothetical protein
VYGKEIQYKDKICLLLLDGCIEKYLIKPGLFDISRERENRIISEGHDLA